MDLELKIISATDLKKSNIFSSEIHPYVVVSISDTTQKTPVAIDGGRNPTWNHPLTFSVPIDSESDLILSFQIRSNRTLAADNLLGEVRVPLRGLIESTTVSDVKTAKFVSYQVKKPSGRDNGVLTFSYRLNYKTSGPNMQPVVVDGYNYHVYPPPPTIMDQSGYGYGYPVQMGYAFGQVVQPMTRKSNGAGLGFRVGFLGGAVAAMLINAALD